MNTSNHKNHFLLQDATFIVLSVIVAVTLIKTGVLIELLTSTRELGLLGSFVAGIFFTSVFTIAPAIVTLGEIAKANSILFTAIFGAMGAVIGDLIIFRFIRDRLSEHLMELIKYNGAGKRVKILFKLKLFRWLTFLVGGLIIASPFPNELGISLLSLSKIKTQLFIPLSFAFNFISIILVGLIAKAL
ncbi:MAG: hypothetical protein WD897_00900 [Parcubacteria group bacterium]